MDDPVAQFMAFTNQDATVAAGCLGMTEGDVMAAVNMFFENPDIANSFAQPAASSAATLAPARPQGSSRPIGREDPSGVIHIDSDDDDDNDNDADAFDIPDDDDDGGDENTGHANLHRIAQESDDAAMAQRLQEEMYGEGAANSDGVRAPIQRTTETLVAPSGYGGGDDDEFEAYEQMRRRAAARPNCKTNAMRDMFLQCEYRLTCTTQ